MGSLPGPVAVVYESGPTGFGLARALTAAGIRCEVAAASKLQRPAGDRVKTDARDALHLARLLRLDEVVAVRVPSEVEESALSTSGSGAVSGGGPGGPDAGRQAPASALEAAAAARDRLLGWEGVDPGP